MDGEPPKRVCVLLGVVTTHSSVGQGSVRRGETWWRRRWRRRRRRRRRRRWRRRRRCVLLGVVTTLSSVGKDQEQREDYSTRASRETARLFITTANTVQHFDTV